MRWSVLVLSWDRVDAFKKMFATNIDPLVAAHQGTEVLVCDQGTKPIEPIRDFLKTKNCVKYVRYNRTNEGTPRSLNQLFLRSHGENVAILSNDIMLPVKWWEKAEQCFTHVPKCGLVGFECTKPPPPVKDYNGFKCHPVRHNEAVFGTWFFKRVVVEDVGAFCQDYHPYGLWDSDYNFRVNIADYQSCYVHGCKSTHTHNDVHETNDYRKMKNFALNNNSFNHGIRAKNYKKFGYWIPFPAKV